MLSDILVSNILMNNSQDMIYFKDKDSKYLLNNKAHAEQFGFDNPDDLIGKSDYDFFPKDFADNARCSELKLIQSEQPIIGIIEKWYHEDGSFTCFSTSKYPLFNASGELIGTWGTSRDITQLIVTNENLLMLNKQLQEANSQLKKLSDIDDISGLFNHRRFHENLKNAVDIYSKERNCGSKNTFCIVLLDIDNFKSVNDTYGHLVGDISIKHVADIIAKNTRINDTCFRYGGDEFAILLLDTDITTGREFSKRLCQSIEASPICLNDVEIKLTVSIGISYYSDDLSYGSLVQDADDKLYRSKRLGKNQVN